MTNCTTRVIIGFDTGVTRGAALILRLRANCKQDKYVESSPVRQLISEANCENAAERGLSTEWDGLVQINRSRQPPQAEVPV